MTNGKAKQAKQTKQAKQKRGGAPPAYVFESQGSGFRSRDVAKVVRYDKKLNELGAAIKVFRVGTDGAGRTSERCVATLRPVTSWRRPSS